MIDIQIRDWGEAYAVEEHVEGTDRIELLGTFLKQDYAELFKKAVEIADKFGLKIRKGK